MNPSRETKSASRFAIKEEALSDEFMKINRAMAQLTATYNLPDHSDVNRARFPWSTGVLEYPEFYAARLWEYPYAILSTNLEPGMKCVDLGCGMTSFTIYLKDVVQCEMIGVDPDLFPSGVKYKGHGVSAEFVDRTGLNIVKGGIESIPLPSDSVDRLFCLSVIEHLRYDNIRRGAREIARVLKPGGKAILTIDTPIHSNLGRPLDLIWDSGLVPDGAVDFRYPRERFGILDNGYQPADVYGLTLVKPVDYYIEVEYHDTQSADQPMTHGCSVSQLRQYDGLYTRSKFFISLINLSRRLRGKP